MANTTRSIDSPIICSADDTKRRAPNIRTVVNKGCIFGKIVRKQK